MTPLPPDTTFQLHRYFTNTPFIINYETGNQSARNQQGVRLRDVAELTHANGDANEMLYKAVVKIPIWISLISRP